MQAQASRTILPFRFDTSRSATIFKQLLESYLPKQHVAPCGKELSLSVLTILSPATIRNVMVGIYARRSALYAPHYTSARARCQRTRAYAFVMVA